jgi:hypothetical protein
LPPRKTEAVDANSITDQRVSAPPSQILSRNAGRAGIPSSSNGLPPWADALLFVRKTGKLPMIQAIFPETSLTDDMAEDVYR